MLVFLERMPPAGTGASLDSLDPEDVSIVRLGALGLWPAAADAVALSRSSENRTLGVSLSCEVRSSMAAEDCKGFVPTLLKPDNGLASLFTLSAIPKSSAVSSFEEPLVLACSLGVRNPGDPASAANNESLNCHWNKYDCPQSRTKI
jgi:hypothetical protein